MIYYIKNEADGGYVYPNRRKIAQSAKGALNKICMKYLTTLEGYLKSVEKIVTIKYKIPIVLSDSIAFFPTNGMKSYDVIYLNFFAIEEIIYLENEIVFIFDDIHQLKINFKTKNYQRLVQTIFIILNYKKSLE